jgi:two-component system, OmpR family, sensor kinase
MRRPSSLAVRTTALCLAVAGVMALVAGGIAVRLVSTASREISQQQTGAGLRRWRRR